MSDASSSGWGHSVHFAKSPMLRFSKGYCSDSFHPISTKLYGKYGNHVGIQAITFLATCQIQFFYGTLTFLLTQDHMGLEISKRYSFCSFFPTSAKLHGGIG